MATSHHGSASNQPDSEIMKRLLDQFENRAKREYPRGRIGPTDEGTLALAVTADRVNHTVVLHFGKPVEWIGLSPADVAKLVQSLIQKAREVATEPFAVNLG